MKRESTIQAIKYSKNAFRILKDGLPTIRHLSNYAQIKPDEAYVNQQGVVKRGEDLYDFQDIRIYFKREPE